MAEGWSAAREPGSSGRGRQTWRTPRRAGTGCSGRAPRSSWSTTGPMPGCPRASRSPSASNCGTTATTWRPISRMSCGRPGRWDEAEDMATHALADGRGGLTTRITALHALGFVALGRGDLDRRERDAPRGQGRGRGDARAPAPVAGRVGAGRGAPPGGRPATVRSSCAVQGLAASSAVDDAAYLFPFLVTGTRAHLQSGDPAAAEAWVGEIAARLRHRDIPGARPAIDHATGLLQLAAGASVRARVSLEAAVAGWAARRRVWEHVGALTDLATVHLRANRPAEAVRIAGEAVAMAERIGSPPLAARARAAVRAGRARHPDEEVWEPLTGASSPSPAWSRPGGPTPRSHRSSGSRRERSGRTWSTSWPSSGWGGGPRWRPGWPRTACYTPGLTAGTEKSSAGTGLRSECGMVRAARDRTA